MAKKSNADLNMIASELSAEFEWLETISKAAQEAANEAGLSFDSFIRGNGGHRCDVDGCNAIIWPGDPVSTAQVEYERIDLED